MNLPLIEFIHVSKSFGDVHANLDLNFKIQSGTIHGIVGENGAGKSTAMNLLFGLFPTDSGEIILRGKKLSLTSPDGAMSLGLGMVHQHFMLAESMTALENLMLFGRNQKFFSNLNIQEQKKYFQSVAEKYNYEIPWDEKIENIPVGVCQKIEILKILSQNAEIIILDEPTAVLTPQETQDLFLNLRQLQKEGKTILIITHKLKEVMALTNNITVFRSGKVIAEFETQKTSLTELAETMMGFKIPPRQEPTHFTPPNEPILEIDQLFIKKDSDGESLKNIHLTIKQHEILGIAGVEGNGQNSLIEFLSNPKATLKENPSNFKILRLLSSDLRNMTTKDLKKSSVGFLPEDRPRFGMLSDRPAWENFLLGHHEHKTFQHFGFLKIKNIFLETKKSMEKFNVQPRNEILELGRFSGGNQQKFIVARELWKNPRFILAAHPTRGVDIGAIEFIHSELIKARTQGAGVLLISSELDELLELSDRILVIYKGEFVLELLRSEFDELKIGTAMGGSFMTKKQFSTETL